MHLKLLSKAFIFAKGDAVALPWNLAAEGGMEAWIERANVDRFSPITNNRVELKSVNRAGNFQLLVGDLTVQRANDHLTFTIPMFSGQFTVTDADLRNGYAELEVDAASVFKVTVLDRGLRPIPQRKLTFLADAATIRAATGEGFRFSSVGVKADENGTFLFLGNPCLWWIELDAETGLTVVPI